MDDITLPPALPLRAGSSSKAESRKRYGPAGDARSRLAQARLALSRQASFDVGGCAADAVDTSPPNSLSIDETDHGLQQSPRATLESTTAATSIRLQRANSSYAAITTSPSHLLSNGSPKKISSQQVRQRLKEHLLSRRVMSVEASWGAGGGGASMDVSTALAASSASPQSRVGLRHLSRSFDSDRTTSSPSPPPPPPLSHTEASAPRPSSPSSLPRKRAAYHRSTTLSLDSPVRPPTTASSLSVAPRTFEEVGLTTRNSIWREGKPPAHYQQSSLSRRSSTANLLQNRVQISLLLCSLFLGSGFGTFMTRQSSYNPQMAHMCSDDLSKSLTGSNTLTATGVEMPLDLTTAAATVSSSDSLRRLTTDCPHQRKVTVGGSGTSVGDISLLMQQFEALRVSECATTVLLRHVHLNCVPCPWLAEITIYSKRSYGDECRPFFSMEQLGVEGQRIVNSLIYSHRFPSQNTSVPKHLSVFNPASLSAPPPAPAATTTAASTALSDLQETAASIVSSLTSLCSQSVGGGTPSQLSLLTTSLFHRHLSKTLFMAPR
ncbi:unnamed protein product [Hydatigera taeniaeformis]|uniref:SUN domain-containing protein n=1 Tax=Hydatigena taeniaeformis TaxID=6205 RepID=A0A0R3X4P6_HYDTA|nr:unnamed protein product [Hydatigera taeniaeformis]